MVSSPIHYQIVLAVLAGDEFDSDVNKGPTTLPSFESSGRDMNVGELGLRRWGCFMLAGWGGGALRIPTLFGSQRWGTFLESLAGWDSLRSNHARDGRMKHLTHAQVLQAFSWASPVGTLTAV